MEFLQTLEQRVLALLEVVKKLKTENAQLAQENKDLIEKIFVLETSVQKGNKTVDDLTQEKELTKSLIDDLISNIDSLITSNEYAG